MASLNDLGSVVISAKLDHGVPVAVSSRSTRGPLVSKLLVGQRAGSAVPEMITLLYTVCTAAQACAYRAALAFAAGTFDERLRADLASTVQLEAMGEHLRCLAYDLPKKLEIENHADVRAIGRMRVRANQSPRILMKDRQAILREFAQHARDLLFGEEENLPVLGERRSREEVERWVGTSQSLVRPLFSYLASLPEELGRNAVPALDTDSPVIREDLMRHIQEPGFANAPKLSLGVFQTSALMRRMDAPALLQDTCTYGPRIFTYFYARMLELSSWLSCFEDPKNLVCGFSPEPGVGISFVQTARGVLTHRIRVDGGVIRECSVITPTDWNFMPGGAAEQALSGMERTDFDTWKRRAELVVRQFDACVPLQIVAEAG